MKFSTLAIASLLAAFAVIFFYAPEEAEQGLVQKIFYIHVACAFTMYIGFFLSFLAGLMYLLEKKDHWDWIGVSGAEVGFFLCTVVLITGPIWAKPIWGTWWTWDPRLTTTFLLWLLYSAYLVMRGYFSESPRERNISAIMAIIAFLDVPLVHLSVRLWRGIHPSEIISKKGSLPESMLFTLVITFVAVVLFSSLLFMMRFRLEYTRALFKRAKLMRTE